MPVQLLHHIVVVYEKQLRGYVFHACRVLALLVIQFDGQIPQRDRIVACSHGDDAVIGRVPLDTRNLLLVVVEACDSGRLTSGSVRGRLPLA